MQRMMSQLARFTVRTFLPSCMILHTRTYSCAKESHKKHENVENNSKSGCLYGLM
jgi:hypothetical protein